MAPSLRELLAADINQNPTGCRVMRWLDGFEGDDRVFLIELLESDRSTMSLSRSFQKAGLEPIGKQALNDHRAGRCTCPSDAEGIRR